MEHVKYLLGHKSVISTERYTHIVNYQGDRYFTAMAKNLDELRQLAEDGWAYFQEFEGVKVFRKPR